MRRVDHPGQHRVDADAAARDLGRGRARQAQHGVLRRDVRAGAGQPALAGQRAGVDDRARSLLEHDGQHVTQTEEDAEQVHADDALELLLGVLGERRDGALDPRVVEERVDAPVLAQRRIDVAAHVGALRHVGRARRRAPAGGRDRLGPPRQAVLVDVDEVQVGAERREALRGGTADPPAAPVISATRPVKSMIPSVQPSSSATTRSALTNAPRCNRSGVSHAVCRHASSGTPSFIALIPARSSSRWSEFESEPSRTQRTDTPAVRAAASSDRSTPARGADAGERSQKVRPRPTSSSDSPNRRSDVRR